VLKKYVFCPTADFQTALLANHHVFSEM